MSADNALQKQTEEKEEIAERFPAQPLSPYKIFFWEAFMFSLTLILGIFSAQRTTKLIPEERIVADQSFYQFSLWHFIIYFFLATFFILFLSSLKKIHRAKRLIYKAIFIFVNFFGGLILFLNLRFSPALSLIVMFIMALSYLKPSLVFSHNLLMIFGLAGIASTFGLNLKPETVILLLLFFSVYDFIAVYKTKHMVKMAKDMMEAGTIFGLIIPSSISDFKTNVKEVRPGGKFLILGGGDIAFPLLLSTSLLSEGILSAVIVAIFSLIGLFAGFYFFINQKVRRPIPALPPIAFFAIIGFLITKFLW